MTKAELLRWPHPLLKTPAADVEAVTDETHAIWQRMIEVMEAMPGYGLAAPQIGIGLRLAVVDCSTERGQVVRLANPEIVESSDELFTWDEASPNLPGVSAKLGRPRRVSVAYIDEHGNDAQRDFEELWATSVQHQIDHLAGRMYFDRLTRTKRAMLLKKAGKRG